MNREDEMAARQIDHEPDEAGRETARRMTDQAARSSRAMSDAAERTARAGAEAAQGSSERVLRSWRSSTDTANRIAERSMDQFSKMFGFSGETTKQTLQQSSENMQAILETTTIIADSVHDLSEEWMQFVQGCAEQNLAHLDRLLGCRSLQELMALQTQMARDHFEALLEGARKTSERSTQTAERAARKISETALSPH
jgi:phasin family protein